MNLIQNHLIFNERLSNDSRVIISLFFTAFILFYHDYIKIIHYSIINNNIFNYYFNLLIYKLNFYIYIIIMSKLLSNNQSCKCGDKPLKQCRICGRELHEYLKLLDLFAIKPYHLK